MTLTLRISPPAPTGPCAVFVDGSFPSEPILVSNRAISLVVTAIYTRLRTAMTLFSLVHIQRQEVMLSASALTAKPTGSSAASPTPSKSCSLSYFVGSDDGKSENASNERPIGPSFLWLDRPVRDNAGNSGARPPAQVTSGRSPSPTYSVEHDKRHRARHG
jgi:hypothetical protein